MPASIPKCLGAVLLAALATAPAASAWPGLNGYIGFGSNRTGTALSGDVYVTPTDAETATQLTFRRADDAQPAFSPDGRRIAFIRQVPAAAHDSSTVMTAPARGGRAHRHWFTRRFVSGIDWQPR